MLSPMWPLSGRRTVRFANQRARHMIRGACVAAARCQARGGCRMANAIRILLLVTAIALLPFHGAKVAAAAKGAPLRFKLLSAYDTEGSAPKRSECSSRLIGSLKGTSSGGMSTPTSPPLRCGCSPPPEASSTCSTKRPRTTAARSRWHGRPAVSVSNRSAFPTRAPARRRSQAYRPRHPTRPDGGPRGPLGHR